MCLASCCCCIFVGSGAEWEKQTDQFLSVLPLSLSPSLSYSLHKMNSTPHAQSVMSLRPWFIKELVLPKRMPLYIPTAKTTSMLPLYPHFASAIKDDVVRTNLIEWRKAATSALAEKNMNPTLAMDTIRKYLTVLPESTDTRVTYHWTDCSSQLAEEERLRFMYTMGALFILSASGGGGGSPTLHADQDYDATSSLIDGGLVWLTDAQDLYQQQMVRLRATMVETLLPTETLNAIYKRFAEFEQELKTLVAFVRALKALNWVIHYANHSPDLVTISDMEEIKMRTALFAVMEQWQGVLNLVRGTVPHKFEDAGLGRYLNSIPPLIGACITMHVTRAVYLDPRHIQTLFEAPDIVKASYRGMLLCRLRYARDQLNDQLSALTKTSIINVSLFQTAEVKHCMELLERMAREFVEPYLLDLGTYNDTTSREAVPLKEQVKFIQPDPHALESIRTDMMMVGVTPPSQGPPPMPPRPSFLPSNPAAATAVPATPLARLGELFTTMSGGGGGGAVAEQDAILVAKLKAAMEAAAASTSRSVAPNVLAHANTLSEVLVSLLLARDAVSAELKDRARYTAITEALPFYDSLSK